jgi:hypothetical protein
MIDGALALGLPEPEETYSSSEHLFEVMKIPAGTTGRINNAKAVVAPARKVEASRKAEPAKKTEVAKKSERVRTRNKKFKSEG